MPRDQIDTKLLDLIIQIEDNDQPIQASGYRSAFIVHFILKAVPLGLVALDQVLALLFEQRYTTQLILIFIVFQFWFTKNITGKRMLGYRWYFGQDQYGQERLMFQCRANDEYISMANPKLFWIVQFVYSIISVLFIVEAIFLIPNAVRIDFRKIQLNLTILASGIGNSFLFLKVSDAVAQRQQVLKTRLGMDKVRKLGLGSISSHY